MARKKIMKKFDEWNTRKKKIEDIQIPFFRLGEIWMMHVGENIGSESCGKGSEFIRPVLIIKIWNKKFFMGIPLTSKKKNDKFHCHLGTFGEVDSFAMLSQVKQVDGRRLNFCIGRISKNKLIEIKEKLFALIE